MSIKNNTTNLQSLLEQVNNLPEAGSGGGDGANIETCTFTINDENGYVGIFAYIGVENGTPTLINMEYPLSFEATIVKNTMVYIYISGIAYATLSSGITDITQRSYDESISSNFILHVTDNATFDVGLDI